MPYSYNGWYASPSLRLRPLVVAGESFVPGVLDDDDVWTVLNYVAQQMHERVEPIVRGDWHNADDWGYNYRLTTNDNSLSCHASGTAIDYNATRHGFGVPTGANFSAAQIAEIRKIVAEAGAVKWGGDYNGTPDAMHFEIYGNKAAVAAAAARIRNGIDQEDEMKQEDFERIRSIVDSELTGLRERTANIVEQNSRIVNKLNKGAERDAAVRVGLTEVLDQLDADSPVRNKLNNVLRLLKEHDAGDDV
jgi:hypothetical protein